MHSLSKSDQCKNPTNGSSSCSQNYVMTVDWVALHYDNHKQNTTRTLIIKTLHICKAGKSLAIIIQSIFPKSPWQTSWSKMQRKMPTMMQWNRPARQGEGVTDLPSVRGHRSGKHQRVQGESTGRVSGTGTHAGSWGLSFSYPLPLDKVLR